MFLYELRTLGRQLRITVTLQAKEQDDKYGNEDLYRLPCCRRKLKLWLVRDPVPGPVTASFPCLQEMEINSFITSFHFSFLQVILFPIKRAYRAKLAQMCISFNVTLQVPVTPVDFTMQSSNVFMSSCLLICLSVAIPTDKIIVIINITENTVHGYYFFIKIITPVFMEVIYVSTPWGNNEACKKYITEGELYIIIMMSWSRWNT
jgi:hypothetical protein